MTEKEAKALLKQNSGRFYVYELCYPTGEPFYVGKGRAGSRVERLFSHGKPDKHNPLKSNIVKKIARNNNKVRYKVCEFLDEEKDAFTLEVELIAKYGRRNSGTGILSNYTSGGEGCTGAIHTAKMRAAISLRTKKYYEDKPEMVMLLDEWNKSHPEEVVERQKKSNITNRLDENRAATSKRRILFFKNNPEELTRMAIRTREWIKNNPEKDAAKRAKIKAIQGTSEARKKQSERVKRWNKENPKVVAEMKAKVLITRANKTTIRLRCLDFVKDNAIVTAVPDGRKAISIWKEFELSLA